MAKKTKKNNETNGICITSRAEIAQEDTSGSDSESNDEGIGNIERTGNIITKKDGMTIHCLSIIGQIEGHYMLGNAQKATKYEHIIPLLVSVEESDDVDGLLVVLNTMGGDVEAGLALAEMISSMKKPTVSLVLGGGHSIGVPLAVSAARSYMVPSATMTIHPVRINGLVIGAPQTYYYFEQMQERILSFITAHSNADKDMIRELMMRTDQIATDLGSIIDGPKAVEYGLIDEVGGLSDALAGLKKLIKPKKKRKQQ